LIESNPGVAQGILTLKTSSMRFAYSAAEIASMVRAERLRGATSHEVKAVASLVEAGPGDLSFLGNPKYRGDVAKCRASVVLVPSDYLGEPGADQCHIVVKNPSVGLAQVCARIEQLLWPRPRPGVHASAFIADGVVVPSSVTIGPGCVVEEGVRLGERVHLQAQIFVGRDTLLGDDCWLMPGCIVAAECVLGDRVRLQPGVVIGSDGFGYEFVDGRHEKVPQIGTVIIGNDVEIGANSTLDRARFSRTLVGEGTKIDNLVQVAHNVEIGRHCLVCSQAGISGSTKIGDFVIIGGQAGLAGHLTVHRGAKIDGQTGVNADVAAGAFVKGSPCLPYQLEQRINVLRRKLPELFRRVDSLESQFGDPASEKTSA
jgi:UDP-3-O-[3-hydroxymyristoyl] glucosamine N-acyltransferase